MATHEGVKITFLLGVNCNKVIAQDRNLSYIKIYLSAPKNTYQIKK